MPVGAVASGLLIAGSILRPPTISKSYTAFSAQESEEMPIERVSFFFRNTKPWILD